MKTINCIFAALAASAFLFSCATKEVDLQKTIDKGAQTGDNNTTAQSATIIKASLPEEIQTRISITEEADYDSAKLSWETDDQITVIGSTTTSVFTIVSESISADGTQAEFVLKDGEATPDGGSFTILYHPGNPTSVDDFDGISYDGQIQDGNGNLGHLNYAMKLANVNTYSEISFSSEWADAHSGSFVQNSVLQLLLKLPADVEEVYSIYVKDDGGFAQTLWLKDGPELYSEPNGKSVIKGYMMVPDTDLSGSLTVRVETEDGAYQDAYTLLITDWVGGAQYTVQKDMSGLSPIDKMEVHVACPTDLIQFKARIIAGSFERFKGASVSIEKSLDMSSAGTWSTSIPDTFAGIFDGKNKTISNLNATQPLFATVIASSSVKDFTLDETCRFTFTHDPVASALYCGPIASMLAGEVSGITVNAIISLADAEATSLVDVGGLIGRANSKSALVSGCNFNGKITIPPTYSTSSQIRVGGIVGCITQKDPVIKVKNSSFGGVIDCQGSVTNESTSTPTVCVGGIVGSNAANVSNCNTVDADDAAKVSIRINETDYNAAIAVHPASLYKAAAVGGIVGYNQTAVGIIDACNNYSTILTNIPNGSGDSSVLDAGGIVGLSAVNTSITSCNNYSDITHISFSATQHLGGVAGYDAGKLGTCYSQSGSSITSAGTPSSLMLGGVIGQKAGGTVSSGSTIRNRGNLSVTAADGSSIAYIGGVIGHNSVSLDGVDATDPVITNNTTITINPGIVTSSVWAVGGVVGYSSANLTKVSNNGGSIKFTGKYTTTGSTKNVYIGGVLGYTTDIITLSECRNQASITYAKDPNTKTNGCPTYVGGIVGGMGNDTNGAGTITHCNNTGAITHNNSNNSHGLTSGASTGGIVGAIVGKSTQRGTISDVSVSVDTNKNGLNVLRGDVGGIAGYASFTDIDGGSCSLQFVGATGSADFRAGGALGYMVNSTLKNFAFSGIISGGIGYMAGLIDNMDAASSIEDCTVDAQITGGQIACLVHTSKEGAQITDCGVKGTLGGNPITLESVMDYSNKATISGTYLLP